jgi:MFS transporter, FHS family, glucose/mannose:H+ symporter
MSTAAGFEAQATRVALAAFFLSGLLMGLPGAILPAWGYHIRDDFRSVGVFFLASAAGLILSVAVEPLLRKLKTPSRMITAGGALGAMALLALAVADSPQEWPWRAAGFLLLGLGGGVLNSAAFQSILAAYERDAASSVNLAGILFGLGTLATALFLSSTFYVYDVGSTLFLIALVPGFAAALFHKYQVPAAAALPAQPLSQVWRDMRSPMTVLFSLLLFFQFGNEWTVAGWLPIFLVRRVGISPETSLFMLAAYWFALLIGRVAAQPLLRSVRHGRLLIGSTVAAMAGCLLLMSTNNQFGAWSGLLLLGGGFAPIYPLVVEWIGGRFPNYHPGVFNGLFSVAVSFGLLSPFLVSLAAEAWGVQVVMGLPMLGTIIVFVLTIGLWLESKLHAWTRPDTRLDG